MKYYYLIIITCLTLSQVNGQINHVLNPSFEDYSNCPFVQNQIYFANHWNTIDTSIYYPTAMKPDYYNNCSPNFAPDSNMFFHKKPKSGDALITSALYSYDLVTNYDFRDYAKGSLFDTLILNKVYCGKFYVNLESYSYYAINKIGAYLDNGMLDTSTVVTPIDSINAQVISNNIITDTTNWVKIENAFIANGTESFITIGCFKNHLNMQTQISNLQSPEFTAYYLIDDISLIDVTTPAFAGTDALITNGDSVYLGRPNEIGPECRWWANGAVVDSNLGFWAKPTQPTQYVLEQKICGNVKYDTVFVNVSGHDGLNSPTNLPKGEAFRLVPNPASSVVNIEGKQSFTSIEIYNVQGSLVEKINNKTIVNYQLSIANYNKGMYILKVTDKNGVQCLKLLVE